LKKSLEKGNSRGSNRKWGYNSRVQTIGEKPDWKSTRGWFGGKKAYLTLFR